MTLAAAAPRRLRQRGFTLLEMLVTLVMVSLTVGLLSESLFQINRLESLLLGGQMQAQTRIVHSQWLRQALGSLQSGDASGRGAFKGSARSLEGITGNPLVPRGGGFGLLQLSLRYDATKGETVLWSGKPEETGPGGGVAVLRWSGDVGRLIYLDQRGEKHDQWPPASGERRRLPAAVALVGRADEIPLVVIDVLADDNPMPSRVEYELL